MPGIRDSGRGGEGYSEVVEIWKMAVKGWKKSRLDRKRTRDSPLFVWRAGFAVSLIIKVLADLLIRSSLINRKNSICCRDKIKVLLNNNK